MQTTFKTYQRGRRQYTLDTSFTNGMMFTNGAVDEGYLKSLVNYDIRKDGDILTPRAGLRLSEIILDDEPGDTEDYSVDHDIQLYAAKDCVHEGVNYRQFILGKPDPETNTGKLWTVLGRPAEHNLTGELNTGGLFEIDLAFSRVGKFGSNCTFTKTKLNEVHNMPAVDNTQVSDIVGAFAFGNNFYFMDLYSLKHTSLESAPVPVIRVVRPKELGPSEAVTYGYNMLSGEAAYNFINEPLEGAIQLTGILPYSAKDSNKLLMTPHQNEDIILKCNFKGQIGKVYKFVWEWRNAGEDTWTTIQSLEKSPEYKIVATDGNNTSVSLQVGTTVYEHLQVDFKAPTEDILVRVQAYSNEDLETVEKAMTVGFNFSSESYGATSNLQQEVYDLKTATGMTAWKNRLVLYGVPKDPTILFLSDLNDPSYFPYPNNISVFDEPIVYAKEFMDSLLVFTTNSIYQITLSSDGTSWNSTLVQSDLHIEPQDRRLIQIVRNMVFFKSGDYYYMLVPRAQASTGKLVLAPISNTIVEFFNHFEKNVTELLADTFDYRGELALVNCFNFLDYEDVHNMYVFAIEDKAKSTLTYLHLDLLYNTVSRNWRIHTFELPHFLTSYKQDATKRGVLAATSVINLSPATNSFLKGTSGRCIQLFRFDNISVKDSYLPSTVSLDYATGVDVLDVTYDVEKLKESLITYLPDIESQYKFPNWQFLDTGYRNDRLERNKRYRELQLQLNNIEGVNLEFGMEFIIDGQVRMAYHDYVVEHVVDESDANYGLIYVQVVPCMNIALDGRYVPVKDHTVPGETRLGEDLSAWVLDQSLFPEVSLWKIRTPVSGKGAAPRIKLMSRNPYRFELMNINWVYRVMNMR